MTDTVLPLEIDALLAEARRRAGLDDFGPTWFLEPMGVLLDSIRREANLNAGGQWGQAEKIVGGLVSRLRLFEALKAQPEILDEELKVAGVIVGLPRSGNTLVHRLLSSAPGMTAPLWWEVQFPSPFPGEERGNPEGRKQAAEGMRAAWLQAVPELMSIHPLVIDQPDEEVIILDQMFVSIMPESMMTVPSYAKWLDGFDQRPAYEDLTLALKFLQWQNPSRRGQRWMLKTPSHLTALPVVLSVFPEARVIMTHRDPVQTVPSYCSMVETLIKLSSDHIDPLAIGTHWSRRLKDCLSNFVAARDHADPDRYIDVFYEDLLKDPLGQARKVFERLGAPPTPAAEHIMQDWLEENAREKRAAHKYTLEEFGLSAEGIERDFAFYRNRFLA